MMHYEVKILNEIGKAKVKEQKELYDQINSIEDTIIQNRIKFFNEIVEFQNGYSIDATDLQHAKHLEKMQLIQSTEYHKCEVIKSSEIVKIENEIYELENKIKFIEDEIKIEREMLCIDIDDFDRNELEKDERIIESLRLKLKQNKEILSVRKGNQQNHERMMSDFNYSAIELDDFGGIVFERFESWT